MKKLLVGIVLLMLAIPSFAGDASKRKFITKGMTEGEVVLKIGKPDNESALSGSGAAVVEKVWSYFPADQDAQAFTTITLKNGVVTAVDRNVSR